MGQFQPFLIYLVSLAKEIQVCSNKGPRSFQTGDKNKIAKYIDKIPGYRKIFFSRNKVPISTKLGPKHPWLKWIQFCSNGVTHHILRVGKRKNAKLNWRNLQVLSAEPMDQLQLNLAQSIPGGTGLNSIQIRTICIIGDNGFYSPELNAQVRYPDRLSSVLCWPIFV